MAYGYQLQKKGVLPEPEFTHLLTVIANLLGMSLHKSNLNKQWLQKNQTDIDTSEKTNQDNQVSEKTSNTDKSNRVAYNRQDKVDGKKAHRNSFGDHDRNMKHFSESHK